MRGDDDGAGVMCTALDDSITRPPRYGVASQRWCALGGRAMGGGEYFWPLQVTSFRATTAARRPPPSGVLNRALRYALVSQPDVWPSSSCACVQHPRSRTCA